MGLFDGLFDFNGDGSTSIDEQFLAFMIFNEATKEETGDTDDLEEEDDF